MDDGKHCAPPRPVGATRATFIFLHCNNSQECCKTAGVTGLPSFETVARLRPIDLVAPALVQLEQRSPASWARTPCPQPAPSAAIEAEPGQGALTLRWVGGTTRLSLEYDAGRVALVVETAGRRTRHVPRRARLGSLRRAQNAAAGPVERLALTLTGTHLTALTRADGTWTARARVDLTGRVDTRDEAFLAGLEVEHRGTARSLRAGAFGQLGLRDPRLVTHADGSPYEREGELWLTATSAGPGFFDTAHTSVWSLHPHTLALRHHADLFFRRADRPGVYADHATHLVRDGDRWLVATSTWGDFDKRGPGMRVGVTVARTQADLFAGRHVLDTEPLPLPTEGLSSVGVWDPHLVRVPPDATGAPTDGATAGSEWLVGYVSARRFFDFFPVVASGPSLDALTVRGAAGDRRATEGTTLIRLADAAGSPWRVLASDGRDNRAPHRAAYPVFDLDMTQRGTVDAPYPTNIPWPTLARVGEGWLMIGFDGTRAGGRILGYGTHGDLVIARSRV